MDIYKTIYPVMALSMMLFSTTGMAAESEEYQMAENYGCIACHALTPQKNVKADDIEVLPVGPSFQEIAQRFYNNKDEGKYRELYRIVKFGSSPFRSKWRDSISGLAMPPNDETMPDLDINRLLVWILTADKSVK